MRMSVITVCLNSERTIRRTIESVLNQTMGDLEYLIIDGSSSDRTLSIAEEYKNRFQEHGIPYRIYSEKDRGIYDAMNRGIQRAQGEMIGILNSDDWYEPDAVETVIRLYEQNRFDLCMCSLYIWKGSRKWIKTPRNRKFLTSRDFCHPSMFVTRQTYRQIGVYDRNFMYYGDFDFWLRARKCGINISISKKAVSNYTLGGISSRKDIRHMAARIYERCKAYRRNSCSALYCMESVLAEAAKMILA